MIQPINRNPLSLQQPSIPATLADWPVAQELLATLAAHQAECIGMAANMIGVHKQIIAVCLGPVNVAMLNPVLEKKRHPYQTTEGCLSLNGQRPTRRYQEITVRYLDQHGQVQRLSLSGIAAQAVQHELDHCQGILI